MGNNLRLTDEGHAVIIPGMAYLYKTSTLSSKNGKRYHSKKWYGKWKSASGRWIVKALSERKRTAHSMLMALCNEDELKIAGVGRREPLRKLLGRFRDSVATYATPNYTGTLHRRVESILDHIEATSPDSIEPARVEMAVADLGESLRTRNHYQAAIKQFCRWLVEDAKRSLQ